MKKNVRTPARILACFLAVLLLFSVFFIAAEADHDCGGDDCAVCVVLRLCENILQQLLVFGAAAASVPLARACRLFACGRYATRNGSSTLITLKVKLSN